MNTIISEAQFTLAQLISYIDNKDGLKIQWPNEIVNDKPIFEIFRTAFSIASAILQESEKFQEYHCSKTTPDQTLDGYLKECCVVITDIQKDITLKNIEALGKNIDRFSARLNKLGVGFIGNNDLSAVDTAAESLSDHCSNFSLIKPSLEAVRLSKSLSQANTNLTAFKNKLDAMGDKVEKAAEIATFLGEVLALIAKIIPFLV